MAEKVRKQFVLLGQQKVINIEKKTGKKPDDYTTAVDRVRFRMMGQSFEETNSIMMKPIFRDYITLACERTLCIKSMLKHEQQQLEKEKRAVHKLELEGKTECKESKADQFRNQIVNMMDGTISVQDTDFGNNERFQAQRESSTCFYHRPTVELKEESTQGSIDGSTSFY